MTVDRIPPDVHDHGLMDGLTDDDHTQYLRADAARELTADWDIGNGRHIKADLIRARDGDGLALQDDGGNGPFIADGGSIVNTAQPAFLAEAAVQNDVTGDSTLYTVVFGSEIFDQNNDFDGTSTFTAPVTGRYCFSINMFFYGITASHTRGAVRLVASNRSMSLYDLNVAAILMEGQYLILPGTVFVDMDANDTVTMTLKVRNGAKVIDVGTGCYFSGYLVC